MPETTPQVEFNFDAITAAAKNGQLKDDTSFKPLPDRVYELLPERLKRLCSHFDLENERDLFMLSCLPVLSGMMPRTMIKYGREWQGLNLYFCGIAGAAGGKGAAKCAYRLGRTVDDALNIASQEKFDEWQADPDGPPPPFVQFYFSGDTSAAAIKKALAANRWGVIFETEVKTLANALNSDWGAWRNILLGNFHGETVSSMRADKAPIRIISPAMSLALTGTPGSFEEILRDTEDGAFSRFFYYYFDVSGEIRNQFGDDDDSTELDHELDAMAALLPGLYTSLAARTVPLFCKAAKPDQKRITDAMRFAMSALEKSRLDPNLQANIKRGGIIAFRIACLLTIFQRFFDEIDGKTAVQLGDENLKSIECEPRFVEIGILITFSLLEHAMRLSELLKIGTEKLQEHKANWLGKLPNQGTFTKQDALAAGWKLKPRVPERTVNDWLRKCLAKEILFRVSHGVYRKNHDADGFVPSFGSIASAAIEETPDEVEA